MPHKHTRKGASDKSTIDLPPTTLAAPLPVSKSAGTNGIFTTSIGSSITKRNNKKRKRNAADNADDTPKAFLRLMAFRQGKKLPKGLDDGVKEGKEKRNVKRRKEAAQDDKGDGEGDGQGESVRTEIIHDEAQLLTPPDHTSTAPKIRPDERMSEFSARVDAALPLTGLITKTTRGGKDPLGLKVNRTKTERKMHRMYAEWREAEKRIQERKEDEREEEEEREMDDEMMGGGGVGGVGVGGRQQRWKSEMGTETQNASGPTTSSSSRKKKNRPSKRKPLLGEINDGNDDPWADLKRLRGEAKFALHDVAQAPPVFSKAPREKLKVLRGALVDVDGVPRASGSLRRREELGVERRSVVEGYRALMKEGRGGGSVDGR